MSDDSSGHRAVWGEAPDADRLELDTDRTSGNWRGVSPVRLDVGPNTLSLDPAVRHLDPDEFDYIRSAAQKRVQVVPAEVARPHTGTAASVPDDSLTDPGPVAPSPRVATTAVTAIPRSAGTTGGSRAVTARTSAIGTTAPWQMRSLRRRRRVILAAVAVIVVAVAVLLVLLDP